MTGMKTGLLWFDDDPNRTLEDKVLQAAAHYRRKHGRRPNLCFVHPNAFNGHELPLIVEEVEVRTGRSILPHHFWLGVAESAGGNGKAQQLAIEWGEGGHDA